MTTPANGTATTWKPPASKPTSRPNPGASITSRPTSAGSNASPSTHCRANSSYNLCKRYFRNFVKTNSSCCCQVSHSASGTSRPAAAWPSAVPLLSTAFFQSGGVGLLCLLNSVLRSLLRKGYTVNSRIKFHYHLSTAIILMLIMAILIWLNISRKNVMAAYIQLGDFRSDLTPVEISNERAFYRLKILLNNNPGRPLEREEGVYRLQSIGWPLNLYEKIESTYLDSAFHLKIGVETESRLRLYGLFIDIIISVCILIIAFQLLESRTQKRHFSQRRLKP